MTDPLITTDELAARLGEPGLIVLDASWHLDGTNARAAFQAARIPGARFFDLDAVSDRASPLPHMMPTAAAFARDMGALGVSEADEVVVYDGLGLFSAARAWWMLRTMGARWVRVLDGGLPVWRAEGRRIESGPAASPEPALFRPDIDDGAVVAREEVQAALDDGSARVLDARSGARFRGEAAEPRPGVRPGHMPGAANLPYADLLGPDGRLKPRTELVEAFRAAGLAEDQPVITTCGSGVTAAVLSLALAVIGRDSRLYDGSWAEWGAEDGGPVTAG